jgi:hypothetical protein
MLSSINFPIDVILSSLALAINWSTRAASDRHVAHESGCEERLQLRSRLLRLRAIECLVASFGKLVKETSLLPGKHQVVIAACTALHALRSIASGPTSRVTRSRRLARGNGFHVGQQVDRLDAGDARGVHVALDVRNVQRLFANALHEVAVGVDAHLLQLLG